MFRHLIFRLSLFLPLLLVVSALSFLLLYLVPGDPAALLAPPEATTEEVQELRTDLGLDDPLPVQYLRFLGGIFHGDLGRSYLTNTNVIDELLPRFLATLELAVTSLFISVPVGLFSGIIAAIKPGSKLDISLMIGSVFGLSMPVFWLGLILMLVFSLYLGWLPIGGRGGFKNLILPAVTLSTWSTAIIARMTRASMLEVLGSNYIQVARGKGLAEWVVMNRHALKNAIIPIITVIGLRFGYMLSGAVVTETVFAWPGMGRFIIQSIQSRDYPNIRGAILLFATAIMLINLFIDVIYTYVDPRIRLRD